EIKAARAEPRCADILDRQQLYGTVIDDGTSLATLTGATGDDLAKAVATLRAGGVVVPRDEYIDNGQATLAILDIDQSKQTGEDPYNTAPRRTFPAYQLTTGVLAYAVVPPSLVQSIGLDQLPGLLVGST